MYNFSEPTVYEDKTEYVKQTKVSKCKKTQNKHMEQSAPDKTGRQIETPLTNITK